jgi:radical SAM protein with 4Fe4S-binding SPASM domain
MTFYIKLTNRCNLQCKHCYNARKSFDNGIDMTADVLSSSAAYIYNTTRSHCEFPHMIIFHGGEPHCAKNSVNIMNKFIDSYDWGDNVQFNITTNLVHELTDDVISLYRRFTTGSDRFNSIGTSWDYDIRFNGNQEDLWKSNVRTLIDAGIDVQPIICVTQQLIDWCPSVDAIKTNLFDMFSQLGIKSINFERITSNGNAIINPVRANNRNVDNWLLQAYKANEQVGFEIPLFDNLDDSIKHRVCKQDSCRRRMCTRCVRTINPDGTIAGCPNKPEILVGRLGNDGVFEPYESFNDEIRKENRHPLRCLQCEMHDVCNAECYQLEADSSGCPGLVSLIEYTQRKFV